MPLESVTVRGYGKMKGRGESIINRAGNVTVESEETANVATRQRNVSVVNRRLEEARDRV